MEFRFRNSNIVIYRFLVIFCIYIYLHIYISSLTPSTAPTSLAFI